MPLTSRAKKHNVVIQCVTRTAAECRGAAAVTGTAGASSTTRAESSMRSGDTIIARRKGRIVIINLQLEILALRHQLGVLHRSVNRPKLTTSDRLVWAFPRRPCPASGSQ